MNGPLLHRLIRVAPFAMVALSFVLTAHGIHFGANGDPGGNTGPNIHVVFNGDPGGNTGPN